MNTIAVECAWTARIEDERMQWMEIMKQALHQPYQQFFGTLANQTRIDIIEQLTKRPQNVSELVKALKTDQSTISHNLRRLEECGFVTVRQNGKERVYTLNEATIKPLLELMHTHMDTYCCHVVERKQARRVGQGSRAAQGGANPSGTASMRAHSTHGGGA
jgi:DNA-binding transcriptional ArsR family regulator